MPSEPLIDLDALDLDRVAVTKDELYASLKQADLFAIIDAIVLHDLDAGLVVGYTDVRADAWWASSHIPGRPIFPGALMVEAGAQVCTYDFTHRRKDLAGAFVGFSGMNHTRFRLTVEPPCRLVFVGRTKKLRSRMFTYDVQGYVGKQMAFEAEVMGVVV